MKANQVTGATGYRLMAGYDIHNLKTDTTQCTTSDVWRVIIPQDAGRAKLGTLFGEKSKFDRLAHWLMDRGVSPKKEVIFGRNHKPAMRFIIDGRNHYREVKNRIYYKKI